MFRDSAEGLGIDRNITGQRWEKCMTDCKDF